MAGGMGLKSIFEFLAYGITKEEFLAIYESILYCIYSKNRRPRLRSRMRWTSLIFY